MAAQNHHTDLITQLGTQAKTATRVLVKTSSDQINQTLECLSKKLTERTDDLLKKNQKDLDAARDKQLSPALIDRLTLSPERIEVIAKSVMDIRALPDPVGEILEEWDRPNGLHIQKVSAPIGVLGMIYESRPNVTIDAAALCLKSHNAVILRGGSESLNSSLALHAAVQEALEETGLPREAVQCISDPDRAIVGEMLKASDYIDVMIPRGGRGLTERVMNEARMPVFAHLDGNCHIYVHSSADPDLAASVIVNAKMRRTGICGAVESLLFDEALDDQTAETILKALIEKGCEVRGDQKSCALNPDVIPATDEDWSAEYLAPVISCKYVGGVQEAIDHINMHGSHHTDSILAEDSTAVSEFLNNVDSAIVMHNTSTQFADGGEFGMGAEIGIGTGKLHARGPVGIRQLATFKYIVSSKGAVRS